MINEDQLKKAGIDYSVLLTHFFNDVELLETVLRAFLSEKILDRVKAAYESGNTDGLRKAVHEAKGASGSAGLNELYEKSCEFVNLLRKGNYTKELFDQAYIEFSDTYTKTYRAIFESIS